MVDYVNIQHGDLDDAAAVSVLVGQGNLADHVEYGLEVIPDYATSPPTFELTEGKVYVLVDTQYAYNGADSDPVTGGPPHDKHRCLLVAHYDPRVGIELPYEGENYIWTRLNISGADDSPKIDVTDTPVAQTDDSIHIATVDTIAEEVEFHNREPDANFESLTTRDLWINESVTWPDGVTTDTHPIAVGDTINNPNEYYDTESEDPPGVVERASNADRADHADHADTADYADEAGDADTLDGYDAEDLLNFAEELRAQPWEPIFDEPYVDDSYEQRPYVNFNVGNKNFDRYRVRLHVENDSTHSAGLGCYINGITDRVYNMINLLPRREYGERVVQRTGSDTWTVGSTMAQGHSLHEFYIALPDPIVTDGPRRRYPLFNAGVQHTSNIGSYQLSGVLTRSVRNINQIRIETGGTRLAIKAQIYGQDFFPND